MQRRQLLSGLVAAPALPAAARALHPARNAHDALVEEWPLAALAADLAAGRTSSQALVAAYLDRIARIDRAGPALNSVIELNPDAPAIARELDAERRAGAVRGPLHGVPLLLKDNIDTADRMATTAGSLALVGARPAADAAVVQRLRAAGAVLLGKTNLSEWANIRSSTSTSGWSARGGLTRNPYALDRNTSGSSSGSAAAVAASLCAAAVGTETDGSILSPASVCGLVGLKPTVGLVGGAGIVPIAHSQDTAGPMARSVRDCALLLGAMVAPGAPGVPPGADYAARLDAGALRGARLGVVRQFFGVHDLIDAEMDKALQALRRAGAELVDPVQLEGVEGLNEAELTVLLYELKADLDAYLAGLGSGAPVKRLADVIEFNRRHAAQEMPWFGQDLLMKAQAKGPLTDAAYLEARARCLQVARTQGIEAVMAAHRLDALVAPTGGPAWRTDLVVGDRYLGSSTSPAAIAGTPSLTVPAGWMHGLPLGLNFFGRAHEEATLLRLGFAFEQAYAQRQPPRYPASVG